MKLHHALSLILTITVGQTGYADEQNTRSETLYQVFRETAESLQFVPQDGTEPYTMQPSPLIQFTLEGTTFGSVYIWKDNSQRLAVIGTVGSIPIGGRDWEFIECHLLSPAPIRNVEIVGQPSKTWQPEVRSLKLRPIPDAPKVAPLTRSRLVQMRALARQFAGTMLLGDKPSQLRLLPQPLYRQDDSSPELDSALFAFVHDLGTDPEILLRIDSVVKDGQPVWHYQPIRFSWRPLSLKHMEQQVWAVDEFREREATMQTTPYVTGLTRSVP